MESNATAMADGPGELLVADVACSRLVRHDVVGLRVERPTSSFDTGIGPTKASEVINDAHSHIKDFILKRIIILYADESP
mmetsp:Transcript_16419/g.35676  ORF Transcript_16419/g.35676 Transcript_16419/m.35676 type:complete len:80 (-) Transcript_16419:55-294(-)